MVASIIAEKAFDSVKVKRGKPHSKLSWEAMKGGALKHIPLVIAYFTYPEQEEGRFSPGPTTTQPMRSCHNLEFSLFFNKLISKLPFPTSSIKAHSSSSLHTFILYSVTVTPYAALNTAFPPGALSDEQARLK